ncbi:hypothetical protein CA13_56320 [Planctomycetes bacterium CA13]|uniref:Uncharacterized protein n=1 Tax=Novipirellula herctigrandis TaxID=2527986 RepID=A0A5C5ZAM1_9BACT|nr:hypothetical protein CA13_56320 [Planctomycetes bacterium CA13]
MSTQHDDKYNDPRARITRRGVLIGLAVACLAVIGAIASIKGRRTRLEKTRSFWGDDMITAFQIGERIELIPIDEPITDVSSNGETPNSIELTTMPGLGLLRHAMLDERSYDWTTSSMNPLGSRTVGDKLNSRLIRLRITDPTANRFEPIVIDLELESGWVGDGENTKSVRLTEHSQPKLRSFFSTVIHAEQKRYDFRD